MCRTMALLFGGSKAFPEQKALVAFARQFCHISERRAKHLLQWVAHGLAATLPELQAYQQLGEVMQQLWRQAIVDLGGEFV